MGDIETVVRRLRSSWRTEQLQAATAVRQLASSSPAAREALIAARCIPPLVHLLSSSNATLQLRAAQALASLGLDGRTSWCQAVAEAGAAPLLVQLCSSGSGEVLFSALGCVTMLCSEQDSMAAASAAGAVPALSRVLQRHTSGDAEVLVMAAAALGELLDRDSVGSTAAAVAAGAPAALVGLLRSRLEGRAQAAVAQALAALVSLQPTAARTASSAACSAVAEAGGIPLLAELLSSSSGRQNVVEAAVDALGGLAFESTQRCGAVVATGCIPRVVQLAGSSVEDVQAAATRGLFGITANQSAAMAAAVEAAGGIPALVALLLSGADTVTLAAQALRSLAVNGLGEAVRAAGAVPLLERLSKRGPSPDAKATAAVTLRALSRAASAPPSPNTTAASRPAARQSQRPPRMCAAPGCGATTGLHRCGGCGTVRYCSTACSRAHWREHRAECRRLQAEHAAAAAAQGERRPST